MVICLLPTDALPTRTPRTIVRAPHVRSELVCWSAQNSSASTLPGDALPVAEEAASGAVRRERRQPDRSVSAFLGRARRARAAYVRADPARAAGVHQDA